MACRSCTDELSPIGPRRNEGHFGVRFGNKDRITKVFLDDIQMTNCYEVDCVAGTAWVFSRPMRRCTCGDGVEAQMIRGDFRVVVEDLPTTWRRYVT